MSPRLSRVLSLLVPFTVYAVAVVLLGDWIIDDAGISYAYARNLAAGFGFVSQPGRLPVEGYSNALWVLILAPTFPLHLFHPILTPKILGALLVLAAFAVLQRSLRRTTGSDTAGFLTTLLLAAAPPIVTWTASGLENSLTLLLAVGIYTRLVERPRGFERQCGALSALLGMAHPEGALYLAAPLLVLSADGFLEHAEPRRVVRGLASAAWGFAILFGPFLLYRLSVFGLPFPHTYYAKRSYESFGSQFDALLGDPRVVMGRLATLGRGIAGPAGPAILAAAFGAAVYLAYRGRLRRPLAVAVVLQATAIGCYLVMEEDWMREFRFGTGAVAFSFLAAVLGFGALVRELDLASYRRALIAAGVAGAISVFADDVPRLHLFARSAPTPFLDVERRFARKFNAYADLLGVEHASVLLPDLGAMLFSSRLRVYDLAGLCEPEVIRTLKKGGRVWRYDHPEFYSWVFEVVKPTFLTSHKFWTNVAAFEADPRFARDYVAINSFEDSYVKSMFRRSFRSGDYVRRDALRSPADLERLRSLYVEPRRPEPLFDRLGDRLASLWNRAPPAFVEVAALREEAEAVMAVPDSPSANRAVTLYARALEHSPKDLESIRRLALMLDNAARLDEARPVWMRMLALATARRATGPAAEARARLELPSGPSTSGPASEQRLLKEGIDALYEQHDPATAAGQFLAILAENPMQYAARYQLAAALDLLGRPEEARAAWTTVLELAEATGDEGTVRTARSRVPSFP